MKPCRDCGGEGGGYPIVSWATNSMGYEYPILSEFWQDCETCEGEGEVVDTEAFDQAEYLHDPMRGVL